jgi:hypothetical protein
LAGSVVDVCLNDSGLVGVWRIARGSALAILREKARRRDIFAPSRECAGAEPPPLEFLFYEKTQNTSDD